VQDHDAWWRPCAEPILKIKNLFLNCIGAHVRLAKQSTVQIEVTMIGGFIASAAYHDRLLP